MPDTIDGVPLYFDEQNDQQVLGPLFPSEMGGGLDAIKITQPIDNSIFTPKGKGAFISANIDFERLVRDIAIYHTRKATLEFNATSYVGITRFMGVVGAKYTTEAIHMSKPFKMDGYALKLEGKLNTKLDVVDYAELPNFEYTSSFDEKRLTYALSFRYKTYASSVPEDKFAIRLESDGYSDFRLLLDYFGFRIRQEEQDKMIREFAVVFDRYASDGEMLNFLYENAPDFVLKSRSDQKKLADLRVMLNYDQNGTWWINIDKWVKDSTNGILNLLLNVNDYGLLHDYMYTHPKLVMEVYKNLSVEGQQSFCYILDFIIKINSIFKKDAQVPQITFKKGKTFWVDSDINYPIAETIWLSQKDDQPHFATSFASEQMYNANKPQTDFDLHPLQLVCLEDVETGDMQIVPALLLKFAADRKEWAKIEKAIFISLSLISIMVSLGILTGEAFTFMWFVAAADFMLEASNLLMMNEAVKQKLRDLGGDYLVDHWDDVYLMVSGLMLSGLVVKGIIGSCAKVLIRLGASDFKLKEFITSILISAILRIETINFTGNTVKLMNAVEVSKFSAGMLKFDPVTRLMKEGVVFIRLIPESEKVGQQGMLVLWKGEVIAEGSGKEVRAVLKDVFTKKGKALQEALDNFLSFGNKGKFLHKPTSGAIIDDHVRKGAFLVGSYWADLHHILKELDYEKLDDLAVFGEYAFTLPKGQKFNLLDISDRIYNLARERGGFFTLVNSKWVDAAVAQKAEVIVVSKTKYLYEDIFSEFGESLGRRLTGFGKEIHRFEWEHHYRYNHQTKRMVPPSEAKGLSPLTKSKLDDNN